MEMGFPRPQVRPRFNAGARSFGARALQEHRMAPPDPVRRRRDVEPRHAPAGSAASPDILVAEPDPDTRQFLRGVLEQRGFHVTCVQTAGEALRAVDESPPSLVLLEIRLDDISGYEVCRALREAHGTDVLIVL